MSTNADTCNMEVMESTSGSEETARGLKPVLGTTLFRRETERRKKLHERGVIPTGCAEIDDALLLGGGFERGCVVGVSAEEVEFGILLGLQTITRALVFEHGERKQRATIITTLPVTTVLPTLRDIIRYQVQSKLGPRNLGSDDELRRCLEAISISRIFDIEGLWEVLRELDEARNKTRLRHNEDENEEMTSPPAPEDTREENVSSEAKNATVSLANEQNEEIGSTGTGIEKAGTDLATITPWRAVQESRASSSEPVTQLPPLRVGPELRPLARNSEILDSEDEEPLSSSPLSSPPSTVAPQSPSPSEHHPQPHTEQDPSPAMSVDPEPEERPQELEAPPSEPVANLPSPVPDIILVTHFSALLTTLFTHNDKTSAHTNLQLLSSHLGNLALSTGALIMLLNTTTSPSPEPSTSTSAAAPGPFPDTNQPITLPSQETTKQQRPLDATLRSIFNPAPPPQHQQQHLQGPNPHDHQGQRSGYSYGYGHAASRLTRRNKPSFGATFAQFLDLHLLCTRVPRTRDDAETAIALGPGLSASGEDVKYAWVVEVLLDELGFYDWEGLEKKRKGKMAMMAMVKDKDRDKDKEREKGQGDDGLPPRVNREQRWAAVDVRDRVVVVNAFGASASGSGSGSVNRGPVRVVGGFGGPRV
ncbi:hypothetical protein F5Y07DRAFT_57003 [Xylaria sp. FL0933]|nr:hypothetical protein F5Y07DRAFT_57003 [Xylaria sp. FL0933]